MEIPEKILTRISALCLSLPEVTAQVDYSRVRVRSTSHSFCIRQRSFCLLIAVEGASGKTVPQLVLRADPVDVDALRSLGHPFYGSRAGPDRIRMVLADDPDWDEIRELLTTSYRMVAPKRLSARLPR